MKKGIKIYLELFWIFFKIGLFTIGGGYAMIPVIEREIVDKHGFVSREEIVDVFAIAQSLPGVIAINTSIYTGYKVAGIFGSIAAALGVIMPSFLMILAIAMFLENIRDNVIVKKAFSGVRAGVVALILSSGIGLFKSTIKDFFGVFVMVVAFFMNLCLGLDISLIILFGAFSGLLAYHIRRQRREK